MITGPMLGSNAWPQSYPTKPIRMLTPFAPGGGTDVLARYIGTRLAEAAGRGGLTPKTILKLPEATLRACGLSAAKTRSVRDLAENRYVRRAQAIVKLADENRSR